MTVPLLLTSVLVLASGVDEGDDRYHFIAGLAEKGLHEQVVREAERFLDRHASHPRANLARYRLAGALFDLGRTGDARPHFATLARLSSFRFADEVAFRHGQCELEAGEHEAAAAAFERVVRGDAEYLKVPATFLLGEAHFRAGRFREAARHYGLTLAAEDAGTHAPDAVHGLAWCAFRLGDHDGAVERCEEFLRRWGSDERAGELSFLAGESHLEAGRPRPALAHYGRVRGGTYEAAALRGAGFARAALDDHEGAAASFGDLLQRFPASRYAAEAALHRGIHLLRAGNARGALETLSSQAAADEAEVCYWRGRAHAARDDHPAALVAFERGLALDPEQDLARRLEVGRGDALYEMGEGEAAAVAYQRAGSDYALHAAAVARLNDGHPEQAVQLASRLLQSEGESPYRLEATLTLAEGYFALKRYGPAQAAFAVVAQEDDDPERKARATARLGWCRYLAGDMQGAREHFERVTSTWPRASEAAESTFMAGRAAQELGDGAAAAGAFGRYLAAHGRGRHAAEATLRLARLESGEAGERRLVAFLGGGSPDGNGAGRVADPDSAAQAHHDLAERLAARGAWAEARVHYGAVVQDHPRHVLAPSARYGLAWCLFSEDRPEQALGHLSTLARTRGADEELVTAALELGVWAAREAGRAEASATAFAAFSVRGVDEERRLSVARTAAAALLDADRIADAEALYAQLLEDTEERAVAVAICVECVYLALDRDDVQTAEAHARAAQRFVPDDRDLAEAFFFVGEAHFEAGADELAAGAFAVAAESPDGLVASRALYKGGFAHLRRGDLDGAVRTFQRVVSEHPACELFGESLFLLGEAHFRAQRYAQAAQWLERVRQEAPRHEILPKALFRLGEAQARSERWREAAATLATLAKDHPQFPHLVEGELWRGRSLAALDQRRAARAAFERVTARDRGVLAAQAHLELGRLYLVEGDRDEALSKFLYVAVLFAHSEEVAEALFLAGQVLESKGDLARAKERYHEALTDHPKARFTARARARLEALGG